jgi:hypothetical protein
MGNGMVLQMQVYVRCIECQWSLNLGTCGIYERDIQFFSCFLDLMNSSELEAEVLTSGFLEHNNSMNCAGSTQAPPNDRLAPSRPFVVRA